MSKTYDTLFLAEHHLIEMVYSPEHRSEISAKLKVYPEIVEKANWTKHAEALGQVRYIFSTWGMVPVDETFLAAAPNLEVIFYGAGTIRYFSTDAMWDRGIRVCSGASANAIPVAEFSLSQILFCLKRGWQNAIQVRTKRVNVGHSPCPGAYGSTVGLLSLGAIGRLVAKHLQRFDLRVIAYEPFISPEAARELGVELVSLEEVFAQSDVVSCHMPWLPETENVLTGSLFRSMKQDASFINTGRGAVVDNEGLIGALTERPDLFAFLDVTHPEPLPPDSPYYDLPNVVLTPHIAGSSGRECRRMGQYMVDDLRRLLAGQPLVHEVTRERAKLMA